MNVIKVKLTIFIKGCICLSCLSMILLSGSCQKDPYVSKDIIQHMRDSASGTKLVENICFIYNNDVYFLNNFNNTPQKITSTPTNTKTEVRISHNLQKIAYINSAGNPEIIDRNGNILNTLTQYSYIKQMDWSSNDSTLYMLIGNQFQYYGPIIHHPLLNFGSIPIGPETKILSATLSKDNDLAYVVEYDDTWNGGIQQKLILKKNDGNNGSEIVNNTYYPYRMTYAKFSTHGTDLVVGIENGTLELYTDLKNYPDLTIEACCNRGFHRPIYRSDKNCIVSSARGFINLSSSFILSVYYIKDGTNNNKPNYNNDSTNLIVDWK